MLFGDVVNQFHDQNGLADASAAEQADFTAAGIGCKQVNNLDPGFESFDRGRLLDKARRRAMNLPLELGSNRASLVDRFTDNV